MKAFIDNPLVWAATIALCILSALVYTAENTKAAARAVAAFEMVDAEILIAAYAAPAPPARPVSPGVKSILSYSPPSHPSDADYILKSLDKLSNHGGDHGDYCRKYPSWCR